MLADVEQLHGPQMTRMHAIER